MQCLVPIGSGAESALSIAFLSLSAPRPSLADAEHVIVVPPVSQSMGRRKGKVIAVPPHDSVIESRGKGNAVREAKKREHVLSHLLLLVGCRRDSKSSAFPPFSNPQLESLSPSMTRDWACVQDSLANH